MNSFGSAIKECREKWQIPLKTVAAYLDIDATVFNEIEEGRQTATRPQVVELAEYFDADENELLILWLCDKLSSLLAAEEGDD
jgi:ribosome-binding protein aMBF1 (putative translation factor)